MMKFSLLLSTEWKSETISTFCCFVSIFRDFGANDGVAPWSFNKSSTYILDFGTLQPRPQNKGPHSNLPMPPPS